MGPAATAAENYVNSLGGPKLNVIACDGKGDPNADSLSLQNYGFAIPD